MSDFVEYPKMIFRGVKDQLTVHNHEEEVQAILDGWRLTQDMTTTPPVKVAPVVVKVDPVEPAHHDAPKHEAKADHAHHAKKGTK